MNTLLSYIPLLLQIILFLLMLGMGMTLTLKDFIHVGASPKAIFTGLFNQIVAVPLLAFAIISIVPMDSMIAMGLMIVGCCPGGAVSNLFSFMAKGDTALSISLTALSSIITVFTIPLILVLSLNHILGETTSITLPVGQTIFNIFKLTALPVFLGILIHHRLPRFSERSKPAISWGSVVAVVLALVLMVVKLEEIGDSWALMKASFFAVVLLNLTTLGIGYGSAKLFGLSTRQSATVSIESGMQNNVLGMAIALSPSLLNRPEMAATAGVYGVVMCILAIGVITFFKRMITSNQD